MEEATLFQYRRKIKSAAELRTLVGSRPRAKKVIMCHGVFDVVHPGHLRHLIYAKSKGDILVVSLTADQHITKGNVRPYVPQDLRALNLAAFEIVDYVIIDMEATPISNIKTIQPDYFAKGYEYVKGSVHPKTQKEIDALEEYGGEIIFTPGDVVYSSTQLIDLAPPDINNEKLMVLMDAEKISFSDLRQAVAKMAGLRVHVVGDTIVDSYTQCSMIGGMTKTPTMSVRYEERQDFSGGAAIVAKHLKAAGAEVVFSTVMGEDADCDHVLQDLAAFGVDCRPVIDPTRPTTNKNAIVVGGYRMLKIDTLDNRPISERIVRQLSAQIRDVPADVVIFSDFRHGLFNRESIPVFIDAIPEGCFRVADSQVASRWGNILDFPGFDLITPNEREARFALGDQDATVRPLGSELFKRAGCRTLMLKMGERGMITFRRVGHETRSFFILDSFAEQAIDPVGAGDALLAYASLAMAATGNDVIASILGSFAAGLECGYDGNAPISPVELLARIERAENAVRYS
ncbi:PfkB family carbohydrate kinase [Azospirillum sp. BE72]|uniref:PfkB family carbohydrate kinase n=1 Tax=Azospirillum sp. BE72 TaxID=2817776 RepID=UPI0028663F40|nr:PfkB family carbohydrate kinase [Azospirillum sp. BE72]MDR6774203.1 rfaE bifunctional protein kinase chain/domain/rfaE bifunctional protein nucleotidyltransferase chain/domain [Azospirillum sp. BE72]